MRDESVPFDQSMNKEAGFGLKVAYTIETNSTSSREEANTAINLLILNKKENFIKNRSRPLIYTVHIYRL